MNKKIAIYMATLSLSVLAPVQLWAAEQAAAAFSIVRGDVDLLKPEIDESIIAKVGLPAYTGNIVRTKNRSRAQLRFIDNSLLNLGSNYHVEIRQYAFDAEKKIRSSVIRSLRGTVRAIVAKMPGEKNNFRIETPTAVASVRGTDFAVTIEADGSTTVVVFEGAVLVRNLNSNIRGELLLVAREFTRVKKGEPPAPKQLANPATLELIKGRTDPGVQTIEDEGYAALAAVPLPAGVSSNQGNGAGGLIGIKPLKGRQASSGAGALQTNGPIMSNLGVRGGGNIQPPPVTPPVTEQIQGSRSDVSITLQFP